MRRTKILLAAASITVLTLSACGSTSKSGAATSSTVADTAAPVDTTPLGTDTVPADTTPITVVASGVHKDEPFCKSATAFNNVDSPFNDAAATSDDFKKFFSDVVTPGIADLRSTAPAALKADVETVVNGYEQLGKVFESNNWDLAKTSADPDLQTLLNSQAFSDAGSNLDDYCGFNAS